MFGAGNADADLMFVGEAPGANEDQQGLPFVGQAGQAARQAARRDRAGRASDVFIANVLKCRPPGNRDPQPAEIEACRDYLLRQVELIEPRVVCTLGNFATKLLRGDPTGITRAARAGGGARDRRRARCGCTRSSIPPPRSTRRAMLETLRADFQRIPELLALPAPEQPAEMEDLVGGLRSSRRRWRPQRQLRSRGASRSPPRNSDCSSTSLDLAGCAG